MTIQFIKIFYSLSEAESFAALHAAKIIIRYDWDDMKETIIKEYEVRY